MIYTTFSSNLKKAIFLFLIAFFVSSYSFSQTVEIPSGSVIIDMGVSPQTYNNSLKPYGLVYSLLKNHTTPVIWSIDPNKIKDGIDFNVDSKNFKGGPFIISEEYLSPAVIAEIVSWEGMGVVTYTTSNTVDVPLFSELLFDINWTINDQNDQLVTDYFEYAGIPSSAYSIKLTDELGACDDLFLIPHAELNWDDHGNLLDWNAPYDNIDNPNGNRGWIWAACKAVSSLESLVDPNDSNRRTNFLTENPDIYPGPFNGYGLIDADDHEDASGDTANYN